MCRSVLLLKSLGYFSGCELRVDKMLNDRCIVSQTPPDCIGNCPQIASTQDVLECGMHDGSWIDDPVLDSSLGPFSIANV